MKKRCVYIPSMLFILLVLTACQAGRDNMKKLRDIEFTVVSPSEVPQELDALISEKKEEGFQLTYADKGYLYMAYGYGKRDTSGYSVEVEECYEAEDVICIKTNLLGPPKDEEIIEESTYPFVVVKIEYMEKNVVFE